MLFLHGYKVSISNNSTVEDPENGRYIAKVSIVVACILITIKKYHHLQKKMTLIYLEFTVTYCVNIKSPRYAPADSKIYPDITELIYLMMKYCS